MDASDRQAEQPRQNPAFATTRWSVVLAAKLRSCPESSAALEDLCRTYWYPLYVYVRRRGYNKDDAADLTQGFFTDLLEKSRLAAVERNKGRFRSFLIASMKNFLSNEWDKSQSQKRGGGRVRIAIETDAADAAYQLEPTDGNTAEKAFERRWALTLLDRVLDRLRTEYLAKGKRELFERIKPTIMFRDAAGSYREIAENLGMSEGAVKVAVHRLRQQYRDLLVHEVSQTVSAPQLVEEEIAELFNAVSQSSRQ